MLKLTAKFGFISISLFALWGCLHEDEHHEENTASLVLNFEHKVGLQKVELDTTTYTNSFGNKYKIKDLRYLISNIILMGHGSSDTLFKSDKVLFVDAETPSTWSQKIPGVEAGVHYHEIRFVFGMLPERNTISEVESHIDSIPTGFRGVENSYHFMQINGKYMDSADTERGFTFHMGNFSPDSSNNTHHFPVDFDVYQTGNEDKAIHSTPEIGKIVNVYLSMDVNKWFETPNTIDLNKVNATMFNPDQQDLLVANGENVFDIDSSSIDDEPHNHGDHDH